MHKNHTADIADTNGKLVLQPAFDELASMELKLQFAWEMKHIMAEQGVSLNEMAKRAGVGKAAIKRLLKPTMKDVKIGLMQKVARALGKSLAIHMVDAGESEGHQEKRPKLARIE